MLVRWIYKPAGERHLIGQVEDIDDPVTAKELIRTGRAVAVDDDEASRQEQAEPGLPESDVQTSGELVDDEPAPEWERELAEEGNRGDVIVGIPHDVPDRGVQPTEGVELPVLQPTEGDVAPAALAQEDAPRRPRKAPAE
jgi:hypothetical protein